jgi:GTP-binding protein HflX
VSDTVGFIRNLPTTLVDAFRATLEEVTAAALLLHVVDLTSPVAAEQTKHVLKVLEEIGAHGTAQLVALNKADLLDDDGREHDAETLLHRILGETARQNAVQAVVVSARSGRGIDELLELIDRKIELDPVMRQKFRLPVGEGRALHLLYERAGIISREYEGEYCEIVADAPESLRNLLSRFAIS